jgi:hypothetical protein
MATPINFSIRKGRTETITVTVENVTIWTGLVAKLFASLNKGDIPAIQLSGAINEIENELSFSFLSSSTKNLLASSLYYEIVLYKQDGSYVKDCNYGILSIEPVVVADPMSI